MYATVGRPNVRQSSFVALAAALALTFVLCTGDAQATHECGTELPQDSPPHECTTQQRQPGFFIFNDGQVDGDIVVDGNADEEEEESRPTGTVVVGPDGNVDGAIRGSPDVDVVLELPEGDVTQQALEEKVSGPIEGIDEVVVRAVDEERQSIADDRVVPVVDGKPVGLPARTEDLLDILACDRGVKRCRLYTALPSVLLAMGGLPTYGERMAAARDGNGGWALIDGADGEWKAKGSTQPNVAFDYRRYGVHAGVDYAVDADGRFGVSVRGLQGSAEMAGSGGEVELSGVGAGAHGTAFLGGGFHVDAQAMATWYDVKLTSGTKEVLTDGAKALGLALGVEVGRRTDVGDGLTVTPGVGLTWADVSLDFADTADGGGMRVSVDDARSLVGRAGLRVEARMEDGLQLSGSAEATHEFSDDRTATASDVMLKTTEAERTGVRVGLGGARSWEEGRYTLRASLGYAARGGGNGEFDGALGLALRF